MLFCKFLNSVLATANVAFPKREFKFFAKKYDPALANSDTPPPPPVSNNNSLTIWSKRVHNLCEW